MKLTNDLKRAIIRAIMSKVDKSEIEKLEDKIQNTAAQEAGKLLPPKVAAVWLDPETRIFVKTNYLGHYGGVSVYIPMTPGAGPDSRKKLEATLDAIGKQLKSVEEGVEQLEARVRAAVNSCSTDKVFKERYPEWAEHLPADLLVEPVRATALVDPSLMVDLAKMGWPKGAKPQATAAA